MPRKKEEAVKAFVKMTKPAFTLGALKKRLGVVSCINQVQKGVEIAAQLRDCFVGRKAVHVRWIVVFGEPEYLVTTKPVTARQAARYAKAVEEWEGSRSDDEFSAGDRVKLYDGVQGADQLGTVEKVLGEGRYSVRWDPDDSLEEMGEEDLVLLG